MALFVFIALGFFRDASRLDAASTRHSSRHAETRQNVFHQQEITDDEQRDY